MVLWDTALEHGAKSTSLLLALLHAFSQPIFSVTEDVQCIT